MNTLNQRLRSIWKTLVSVLLIAGLCVSLVPSNTANSLSGSEFNAGHIIDDYVFYNANTMNADKIQGFLNTKVPNCDTNGTQPYAGTTRSAYGTSRGYPPPFVCLKDYRQTTENIAPESGLCNGYTGAANETAAAIIAKVAISCGINPQVLLVTLQKEQSLVTDDWPWTLQYTKAMGYNCPDSDNVAGDDNGNGCVDWSEGFFRQVYYGAHRFKYYKANPTNYNYRAGRNNTILWHPNANCGTSNVFIQNQATAALYIYTPYRPNQAALNHLYDTGDNCSSYGVRNFWRMFNDWFGNPLIDVNKDVVLIGDWDGDGDDTPAIRRGNKYYIDYGHDGDVDVEFGFGLSSDEHLVGDWDGDGDDDIALKRGERYYFDFDFDGISEMYQGFGNPTDIALVGDWDNDDRDEIGLKRGDRFYFNFDYDGKSELYMGFGNSTDVAIVGDWDGDGDDNIGLRRGDWYFLDYGHDGEADARFGYGSTAHKVIVGDWDDDGKVEVGLNRGEFYYFDNNLDGKTEVYAGIGSSSDKPVLGDWDGDGIDTIGIKRSNQYFLDNNNDGSVDMYIFYGY